MVWKSTLNEGAVAALFAVLVATGCGTTPGERAASGALLGAGTGAAFGSLSGNAGTGALVGGAGGAAVGALTTPPRSDDLSSNDDSYREPPYPYMSRCVRWSSYSGRCTEWIEP